MKPMTLERLLQNATERVPQDKARIDQAVTSLRRYFVGRKIHPEVLAYLVNEVRGIERSIYPGTLDFRKEEK